MKNYYFKFFANLILVLGVVGNIFSQNNPPTFTSTAVTSVAHGQTYTYNITANDADGDLVTVTAPTLPTWLTLSSGTATVGTLAGSGVFGFADGTGVAAQFNYPATVAVDASGTVYVADLLNNRIRKITPAGVVTTLAGSGAAGFADGMGTSAQFNFPIGVAVDASGTVYVADTNNNRIRKITPAGVVSTFAGSGAAGFADGTGLAAKFGRPRGVAVDASGTVYVGDTRNNVIRKITPAGVVTTLAGSGVASFADGTGLAAKFNFPYGVAVDASGTVYVADANNNRIRKITPAGVVTTLAGSTIGFADGTGTAAQFRGPYGVAVDASGTVYVADSDTNRIRKITPTGVVTTLAGSGVASFTNGTGTVARFKFPTGVAVDASGTVYVADSNNQRIRKIVTNKTLTGTAPSIAGTHSVVLNANDSHGGSTNQSFTLTVNSSLGIDKNIIKGFALYPNPVGDVLIITAQEAIKQLKVFNLLGQKVSQKFTKGTRVSIDLSVLPLGIYFVHITTDKTTKAVKIVKR